MSFVTEAPKRRTSLQSGAVNQNEANIAAVFTGGTIAVSANKTTTVVPALSGREIIARVPEIAQFLPSVRVTVHDFATLPGPHISPEMMLTLAGFVRALVDPSSADRSSADRSSADRSSADRSSADRSSDDRSSKEHAEGIVITHGTDSMEETAYFLDLVIGDLLPIIVTGSMHTSTDAAWDGGRNLVDALAVAASPAFRGMGTLVVMNGEILAASEVTKTHTMNPGTFRSLDFGPLGKVNTLALEEPCRTREPMRRRTISLADDAELPYIELLKTYSGMDDRLFIAALKAGAAGIVVEAMGQGNVPPGVINGISRAREMNIPVVITTRCQSGPVRPYYAYEGAGRELERLGCIFAPYLTGPKARIKLMVALAAGIEGERLREIW